MEGEGANDPCKLNVCFYRTSDGFVNINIEQREVLKLITQSKYYDEEINGGIDFMQAQWITHNAS